MSSMCELIVGRDEQEGVDNALMFVDATRDVEQPWEQRVGADSTGASRGTSHTM